MPMERAGGFVDVLPCLAGASVSADLLPCFAGAIDDVTRVVEEGLGWLPCLGMKFPMDNAWLGQSLTIGDLPCLVGLLTAHSMAARMAAVGPFAEWCLGLAGMAAVGPFAVGPFAEWLLGLTGIAVQWDRLQTGSLV